MEILPIIFLVSTINLINAQKIQGNAKNRERRQTNIYEFIRSLVDANCTHQQDTFSHLFSQRTIANIYLPGSQPVNINFPAENFNNCNCGIEKIQNQKGCLCPSRSIRCTFKTRCVLKEECIEGVINSPKYEEKDNELCEDKDKICCSLKVSEPLYRRDPIRPTRLPDLPETPNYVLPQSHPDENFFQQYVPDPRNNLIRGPSAEKEGRFEERQNISPFILPQLTSDQAKFLESRQLLFEILKHPSNPQYTATYKPALKILDENDEDDGNKDNDEEIEDPTVDKYIKKKTYGFENDFNN